MRVSSVKGWPQSPVLTSHLWNASLSYIMESMTRVYMDLCSLKRPFDDQSQGRIAVETGAVLRILDKVRQGALRMCASVVLTYENAGNPDPVRRARVERILDALTGGGSVTTPVRRRALALAAQGIGDLDALHLAVAEAQGAKYFITCDDRLLKAASRIRITLKVVNPISFMWEIGL